MPENYRSKLNNARGLSRIHWIIIVLVAALVVAVGIPVYNYYKTRADALGCLAALDTAWRQMRDELLYSGEELMAEDANSVLAIAMPERYKDSLCPAQGTIYLIKDDEGGYTPVCGIHDSDKEQRTRLNASYAMSLLEEEIADLKEHGNSPAQTITITLNGKDLKCENAAERPDIHRGTDLTKGYSGIVAFFGLDGDEMTWFLYADTDHYACWNGSKWTGDSYGDPY